MLKHHVLDSGKAGRHLLIMGAIHGNETCGPHAIGKFIEEYEQGKHKLTQGKITLIPICNEEAYANNVRYVNQNLNRIIKKHKNPINDEQHIANSLCDFIAEADVMLDLHSFESEGSPMLFLDHPTENMSALADILDGKVILYGWDNIYKDEAITSDTTETWAYKMGTQGMTFECGQNGSEESNTNAYNAILKTLSFFNMLEAPVSMSSTNPTHIEMDFVVMKNRAGDFVQKFKDVEALKQGTLIARYENGEELRMPYDGFIVLPKAGTPIGEEWYYIGRIK